PGAFASYAARESRSPVSTDASATASCSQCSPIPLLRRLLPEPPLPFSCLKMLRFSAGLSCKSLRCRSTDSRPQFPPIAPLGLPAIALAARDAHSARWPNDTHPDMQCGALFHFLMEVHEDHSSPETRSHLPPYCKRIPLSSHLLFLAKSNNTRASRTHI